MEALEEKSDGLKFAEKQLLRHGWKHGKGLGRCEDGISEAVKVKVKCDKSGVGHREGEHFSFHWWDHVFNKASSSLQVASHHNGVQLRKMEEEGRGGEGGGVISNKKPRKAALEKSKLYGCFVKSATLLSGREQPEPKEAESEDSSSDEDDDMLDLSSATRLSDSDLMRVCGGRTAHKGARHGLTMSAKLARLEQQEAEFMAKYDRRNQSESGSSACSSQVEEEKKKKKKKKKSAETESPEEEKKKKKKSAETESPEEEKKRAEDDLILLNENEENTKKRKKKSDKESSESRLEKKRRRKRRSEPEEKEEEEEQ